MINYAVTITTGAFISVSHIIVSYFTLLILKYSEQVKTIAEKKESVHMLDS